MTLGTLGPVNKANEVTQITVERRCIDRLSFADILRRLC